MDSTETQNPEKENAQAGGVGQSLRQKSLKAAGISCLLADAALLASGCVSGKYKEGLGGIFGWTAGFIAARYGNPKAEKQLEQIERRLGAYLRRQGVEIPKNPTNDLLNKEGGVIDNIESFLYTYPSQMMNVFYSLIGVQFARSGRLHKDHMLVADGSLLIAGAMAGLLIQEKKSNPAHPPEGLLQRTWSWAQEKPLRITSTLFNISLVGLTMSALNDKKTLAQGSALARKSYLFKLLAVAGFALGNIMIGLSSKSEGASNKMDKKTLNELGMASAQVIAAQPKEVQEKLLEHMAGFLTTQPYVHMKASELSNLMHAKLAEVSRNNPPSRWQGRVGETKAAQPQPSL